MTEAEWLACEDYPALLIHLRGELTPAEKKEGAGIRSSAGILAPGPTQGTTPARLRAFATTCLPRWDALPLDALSRTAIDSYSEFLHGTGTHAFFWDTCLTLQNRSPDVPEPWLSPIIAFWDDTPYGVGHMTWQLESTYANHVARTEIAELLKDATDDDRWAWGFFGYHEIPLWNQTVRAFNKDLPPLLRETVGNPFRPVICDPEWRTSTVLALAKGIYDDRAFDRMPILADALQDAGCDDDNILDHCRGPGPHVRGCWVVDLVLGKD